MYPSRQIGKLFRATTIAACACALYWRVAVDFNARRRILFQAGSVESRKKLRVFFMMGCQSKWTVRKISRSSNEYGSEGKEGKDFYRN